MRSIPYSMNKKSNNSKSRSTGISKPVNVPVARGVVARSTPPRVNAKEGVNVCRSEFVASLITPSANYYTFPESIASPGFDLNPGSAMMFPWLSGVALHYERYRFNRLSFRVVPSQATSTNGRYYLAVDYDFDDVPPVNKVSLMNNRTAVEAPVWMETELVAIPSELNRDLPYRYVLSPTRTVSEPRTVFSGFLMFAVDSTVSGNRFDLWVDYDVTLLTPCGDELVLYDTITATQAGGQWAATSDVIKARGTAFFSCPDPNLLPSGPYRFVRNGYDCPTLTVQYGTGSQQPTYVLDLGQRGKGSTLTIQFGYNTADKPSDIMVAAEPKAAVTIFDGAGNNLGNLTPTLVTRPKMESTTGMWHGREGFVNTAGQLMSTLASVYLADIYLEYPLVRYLVPWLYGIAALGVGNSGYAVAYSDV